MKNFDLRKALSEYKPFDNDERRHVNKTLLFMKSKDNLYARSNLIGHINGSAYLLSSDLDKVLLMHHKVLNDWFQFGGHSDGDKNTLNVARRETLEESGIKDFKLLKNEIFDVSVNIIPNNEKRKEPKHIHYDVYFVFVTDNFNFIESDESNGLRWFTMYDYSQLPQNEQRNRFIKKWGILREDKNNGK